MQLMARGALLVAALWTLAGCSGGGGGGGGDTRLGGNPGLNPPVGNTGSYTQGVFAVAFMAMSLTGEFLYQRHLWLLLGMALASPALKAPSR